MCDCVNFEGGIHPYCGLSRYAPEAAGIPMPSPAQAPAARDISSLSLEERVRGRIATRKRFRWARGADCWMLLAPEGFVVGVLADGEFTCVPFHANLFPDWPGDIAAAFALEGEMVSDKPRQAVYIKALAEVIIASLSPDATPPTSGFAYAHASPLHRCLAYLAANGVEIEDFVAELKERGDG